MKSITASRLEAEFGCTHSKRTHTPGTTGDFRDACAYEAGIPGFDLAYVALTLHEVDRYSPHLFQKAVKKS